MKHPRSGLSLLEAIIASFLLLCSFLVVINLFHSALHYSVRIENQQLAGMLAERHLEQMRSWSESSNGSGFNYDNLLTTYNVPASDIGPFTVTTRVVEHSLYSSCSSIEQGIAAAGSSARCLTGGTRKAQVTVRWDQGTHQVVLSSLFSRPCLPFRGANALVISAPPGGALAKDGTANFTATAYDSNNQPIPGLMLEWDIVPIDGNATLTQLRDGSQATLTNSVSVNGSLYYTGGSMLLHVSAKLHGQTSANNSTLITLAGP